MVDSFHGSGKCFFFFKPKWNSKGRVLQERSALQPVRFFFFLLCNMMVNLKSVLLTNEQIFNTNLLHNFFLFLT